MSEFYIDNTDLFRDCFLGRCSFIENEGEVFYNLKVILRKKDGNEDKMKFFGVHDEKVMYHTVVDSRDKFEKELEYAKYLLRLEPKARVYVDTNLKSVKKSLMELGKQYNGLVSDYLNGNMQMSFSKRIFKSSKSVVSVPDSNYSRNTNFILYDIDGVKEDKCIESIVEYINMSNTNSYAFSYKTLNGFHILVNPVVAGEFKQKYRKSIEDYIEEYLSLHNQGSIDFTVEEKKDVMLLLLANGK